MTTSENNKCAHLPCKCMAQPDEKYCGQACKEAGSERSRDRLPVRPWSMSPDGMRTGGVWECGQEIVRENLDMNMRLIMLSSVIVVALPLSANVQAIADLSDSPA